MKCRIVYILALATNRRRFRRFLLFPKVAPMSRSSTSRSMEEERLYFDDPKEAMCSAPIALGVGRGEERRVLYFSRERLTLHSPVFERMLAEGNGFRESEPDAVIELPNDDPKEFDALLWLIFYGFDVEFHRALRLASKYLMEDVIRYFDSRASMKANGVLDLSRLIRCIDNASLPRTKARVFREVCTQKRLDELRKHGVWNEISETLCLELMEHYYDDQEKANGRKEFCSIDVPEIQWPDLLTFESPAAEHCGGVASLRLVVGRDEEKRMLYYSRELIFGCFPSLRERLRNGGDSLELEDDSADDFVYLMNWALRKRPWKAFSAHQQSAMLCLANKYQCWLDFHRMIDPSKSFTPCHKLYLAEQCRLDDLQKKYTDEICGNAAKFDKARKSKWWPQLSDKLRSSLLEQLVGKIDLSTVRFE